MSYDFDKPLNRTGTYALKWDEEIERLNDSSVLSFGTASMDFPSPEPVLDAIRGIAAASQLGYPKIKESYYRSIVGWFAEHGRWQIDPSWISNCVGVYPSCWITIEALTRPGDGIIILPFTRSLQYKFS